ncbi:MAG: hypothetical protein ACREYC_16575, partial [Gammaproteobacteria bacterium]
ALLSSTGTLRIIERNGATIRDLAASINVGTPGAVTLEVIAFDDRIRATVGEQSIEGALGTIREGRLALVSRGGGRFLRLLVSGLDAWRFHAHTSRYDDFPAHIESFDGVLGVLNPGDVGAPTSTVADLLARTAAEIPQVMIERAEVEGRQRLFETWTTNLGLPLRENPRILSLTRWIEESSTSLLVLESDEPLPFSSDVTLALSKKNMPLPGLPPCRTCRQKSRSSSPKSNTTETTSPRLHSRSSFARHSESSAQSSAAASRESKPSTSRSARTGRSSRSAVKRPSAGRTNWTNRNPATSSSSTTKTTRWYHLSPHPPLSSGRQWKRRSSLTATKPAR